MNKTIKNLFLSALSVMALSACNTDIENIQIQYPEEHDAAYYENLRAYKNSKHQIAFGWFGHWTAMGSSPSKYLSSIPDSVDVISIWGEWSNLTPEKIEDLRQLQQVKGTKVMFTVFAHDIPEPFDATPEGIKAYALSYVDSIHKYGYDGIDLDYEPGFGGKGEFINPDNMNSTVITQKGKDNMEIFVRTLAEHVGPKSGTGKLFAIDGVPYALNQGLAELFDYGIVQSYDSSGDSDLQSRFDNADKNGWKPEQYIFTENFEKWWSTGGKTSFRDKDGNVMNSLQGMARFNPTQGAKGGCGSYHMEYEYNHTDKEYKYLREAIQIMNPAKR